MAITASQAAQQANVNGIIFLGYGDTPGGQEAVRDGKLAATMGQYSTELGQIAMETVLDYFYGHRVDQDKPFPLKVISKKDIP